MKKLLLILTVILSLFLSCEPEINVPERDSLLPVYDADTGTVSISFLGKGYYDAAISYKTSSSGEEYLPYEGPFEMSAADSLTVRYEAGGEEFVSEEMTIAESAPASPEFSISGSNDNRIIEFTSENAVCYTSDGTDPRISPSRKFYREGDSVSKGALVRFASYAGMRFSEVGSFYATAIPSAPQFSEDGDGAITISAESGSDIFFTVDGSDPVTSRTAQKYTGSLRYEYPVIVKAAAYRELNYSSVGEYASQKEIPAPVISHSMEMEHFLVRIDTIPETFVRYTIDGSDPTLDHGILYRGEFPADGGTTVKAVAYRYDRVSPVSEHQLSQVIESGSFHIADDGLAKIVTFTSTVTPVRFFYSLDSSEPDIELEYPYRLRLWKNCTLTMKTVDAEGNESVKSSHEIYFDPLVRPSVSTGINKDSVSVALSADAGTIIRYSVRGGEWKIYSSMFSAPFGAEIKAYSYVENPEEPGIEQRRSETAAVVLPEAELNAPEIRRNGTSCEIFHNSAEKIFYTLDGSKPGTSEAGSTLLYTGPFFVSSGTTVKAVAVRGNQVSPASTIVVSDSKPTAPSITRTWNGTGWNVTIENTDSSADKIVYSINNGYEQSEEEYREMLSIPNGGRLRAYSVRGGVKSEPSYVVLQRDPVIEVEFSNGRAYITISTPDSNKFVYSLDGSDPTRIANGHFSSETVIDTVVKARSSSNGIYGPVQEFNVEFSVPLGPYISWSNDGEGRFAICIYSESNGNIYYTTDGTDPKIYGSLYRGGFSLPNDSVVKAVVKVNGKYSDIVTFSTPVGKPEITVMEDGFYVEIGLDAADGTVIRYTTDGTDPNVHSDVCTDGTIIIDRIENDITLRAAAWRNGERSDIEKAYIAVPSPAAPGFSAARNEDPSSPWTLSISSSQRNALVEYSLDGTLWNEYVEPLTIHSAENVKARVSAGSNHSSVVDFTSDVWTPIINLEEIDGEDKMRISIVSDENSTVRYAVSSQSVGDEFDACSESYSGPFIVEGNVYVSARAYVGDAVSGTAEKKIQLLLPDSPQMTAQKGKDTWLIDVKSSVEGATLWYRLSEAESWKPFTEKFQVHSGKTVYAKVNKNGFDSEVTEFTTGVLPPSFSVVPAGNKMRVRIIHDSDTSVYYTTDGTMPDSSDNLYYDYFDLSENCILSAVAYLDDVPSEGFCDVIKVYTPKKPSIVIEKDPSSPVWNASVTPASLTGVLLYCVDDGPFVEYSGPVTLVSGQTIMAKTVDLGEIDSFIEERTTGVIIPEIEVGKSDGNRVVVSAVYDEAGSVLRYTIDGTDPTKDSETFGSCMSFSSNERLKIRAFLKDGSRCTSTLIYDIPVIEPENCTLAYTADASAPFQWKVAVEGPRFASLSYSIDGGSSWMPYMGPIPVASDVTVSARAEFGGLVSEERSLTTPIRTPEIRLEGNFLYVDGDSTTRIMFTCDDTDPDAVYSQYLNPVELSDNSSVTVYADKNGKYSDRTHKVLKIRDIGVPSVAKEIVEQDGKLSWQIVMTSDEPKAEIWYSTNGKSGYQKYSEPINLHSLSSLSVQARVFGEIISVDHEETLPVIAPRITVTKDPASSYAKTVLSIVSDPQTAIKYTLDGSEPDMSSFDSSGKVELERNSRVRIAAWINGQRDLQGYDELISVNRPLALPVLDMASVSGGGYFIPEVSSSDKLVTFEYDLGDGIWHEWSSSLKLYSDMSIKVRSVFDKDDPEDRVVSEPCSVTVPVYEPEAKVSGAAGGRIVSFVYDSTKTKLWYTTDGTDPSSESSTRKEYRNYFSLGGNFHVRAVAEVMDNPGKFSDEVAFNVVALPPEPPTISFTQENGKVRWTMVLEHNGTPSIMEYSFGSSKWYEYEAPVEVPSETVVFARSKVLGTEFSNTSSSMTAIAAPYISHVPLNADDPLVINVEDGYEAHYTLDGREPREYDPVYSDGIVFSRNQNLKVAVLSMGSSSFTVSAKIAVVDPHRPSIKSVSQPDDSYMYRIEILPGDDGTIDCMEYSIDGSPFAEYSSSITAGSLRNVEIRSRFGDKVSEVQKIRTNVAKPRINIYGGIEVSVYYEENRGIVVRYTTDGSTPNESSKVWRAGSAMTLRRGDTFTAISYIGTEQSEPASRVI